MNVYVLKIPNCRSLEMTDSSVEYEKVSVVASVACL